MQTEIWPRIFRRLVAVVPAPMWPLFHQVVVLHHDNHDLIRGLHKDTILRVAVMLILARLPGGCLFGEIR